MGLKLLSTGFFAFLFTGAAFAASFDCQKAQTKMEKLICSDDALSILDEELNQAFKLLIEKSSNKAVIRTWQKNWLSSFTLAQCGDVDCLKIEFARRIVLFGEVAVNGSNVIHNGIYKATPIKMLYGEKIKGEPLGVNQLTVIALKNNKFDVTGQAFWYGSNWKVAGPNIGEVSDVGVDNGKYVVVGKGQEDCQIKFKWVGKDKLNVLDDNLKCGGLNVSFVGAYAKTH